MFYLLAGRRRKIMLENLDKAFEGTLSERELKRIARGSWISLVRTAIEFLSMPRHLGNVCELIDLKGEDYLKDALSEGKGVILMVAHLGNWELGGATMAELGYPFCAIVRPQEVGVGEQLISSIRSRMGVDVISKKNALMAALRALKENKVVAILVDQHSRKNGVVVDFFGRPASTLASPAVLSLKTGCPVLPSFPIRMPDGSFVGFWEPAIHPVDENGRERDVVELTQEYTNLVEKYVRKYPDQWMWMHRRWRPGDRRRKNE